jgi:hypothetical protein
MGFGVGVTDLDSSIIHKVVPMSSPGILAQAKTYVHCLLGLP